MASEEQIRRIAAEGGKQSLLDSLERSGGFGAVSAAFDRGEFSRGGGGGGQPSGADVIASAQRIFEQQQRFLQPALSTLEASRAKISPTFGALRTTTEAQRPTIEQRYQDTLEEITKVTRGAAAQEFSTRGIPLSSGLVEQTVGSRLGPQISQAATQRDVNLLGLEQLLANIGVSEFEAGRDIDLTAAGFQAGLGQTAISGGLQEFGIREQGRLSAIDQAIQQNQLRLAQQESARDFGFQQEQFEFKKQQALKPGKATQFETQQGLRQDLLQQASTGQNLTNLINTFGAGLDQKEIIQLYNLVSPFGVAKEEKFKLSTSTSGVTT